MHNPFSQAKTVAEIKEIWMSNVFTYHPDTSGYDSTQDFQNLNNYYHAALQDCEGHVYQGSDGQGHTYYYNEAKEAGAIDAIDKLIRAGFSDKVSFDLVGTWVWVHGIEFKSDDFKIHKSLKAENRTLKNGNAASFLNWHSKRKLYYWKPEGHKSFYNPGASYGDLQSMYGSQVFNPEEKEQPVGHLAG